MEIPSRTTLISACAGITVLLITATGAQTARASDAVAVQTKDPMSAQQTGVIVGVFGAACVPTTNVCWPGGTLSVGISGDKKYIGSESADVTDLIGTGGSGGYFCNWHIDFSDHDTNGNDTYHSHGVNHPACTTARLVRDTYIPRSASRNAVQSCSELWSEGAQVAKVCIDLG